MPKADHTVVRAPYTVTNRRCGGVAVVVSELATESVMRSSFCFIAAAAVAAALQIPRFAPASAEGNAAPPAAPPQSQTPPQGPQAQAPSCRDSDDRDSENRRFVFHRVDGNLVRLDMCTGAVTSCSQSGAEWTCVPSRDERAALDHQIAQLQRDNAILKNALLEHGVPLPGGMAPPPPSSAGGWWSGDESIPRPPQTVPPTPTPSPPAQGSPAQGASPEGEMDRIKDAVESGWRRLVEVMTNLKRDLEK
jgi:hypothetical protein